MGGGIILPLSVLALGWTIEKGTGTGALAGCIVLLVADGVGLMVSFSFEVQSVEAVEIRCRDFAERRLPARWSSLPPTHIASTFVPHPSFSLISKSLTELNFSPGDATPLGRGHRRK